MGYYDGNGIWIHEEIDTAAPAPEFGYSGLLNLVGRSLDTAIPDLVGDALANDPTVQQAVEDAAAPAVDAMLADAEVVTANRFANDTQGAIHSVVYQGPIPWGFNVQRGTPVYDPEVGMSGAVLNGTNLLFDRTDWLTIECIVSADTAPGGNPRVLANVGGIGYIGIKPTGEPFFQTHIEAAAGTTSITDGAQHHLAFVIDRVAGVSRAAVAAYIDGDPITTNTELQLQSAGGTTFTIGGFAGNNTADWTGNIREVRISNGIVYNGAFTPPTERALHPRAEFMPGRTQMLAHLTVNEFGQLRAPGYPSRPNVDGGAVWWKGPSQPPNMEPFDQWTEVQV